MSSTAHQTHWPSSSRYPPTGSSDDDGPDHHRQDCGAGAAAEAETRTHHHSSWTWSSAWSSSDDAHSRDGDADEQQLQQPGASRRVAEYPPRQGSSCCSSWCGNSAEDQERLVAEEEPIHQQQQWGSTRAGSRLEPRADRTPTAASSGRRQLLRPFQGSWTPRTTLSRFAAEEAGRQRSIQHRPA